MSPSAAPARNEYPRLDPEDIRQEIELSRLQGKPQHFRTCAIDTHIAEANRKHREAAYARGQRELRSKTPAQAAASDILAEDNILHLRFVEEQTVEQIAELYGVSARTAQRRIDAALESARQTLEVA